MVGFEAPEALVGPVQSQSCARATNVATTPADVAMTASSRRRIAVDERLLLDLRELRDVLAALQAALFQKGGRRHDPELLGKEADRDGRERIDEMQAREVAAVEQQDRCR